jgi:DNA-binding NarL/FixJ family response regulator
MPAAITIMILSSDRIFADALHLVLSGEEELRVVAPAVLGNGADTEAALSQVDVILIDATPDRAAALAATTFMRERCTSAELLVLGLGCEDEGVLDFVQAGATGYVLQDASPATLVAAVRALHADQTFCSPRIAAAALVRIAALSSTSRPAAEPACGALTERERETLRLMEQGLSNKEIGRALDITVQTVKNHVHHILEKLGVHRRRDAVRLAYEIGLLREPASPWTSFES